MKRILLCAILISYTLSSASAQKIEGYVYDEQSKEAMLGVVVRNLATAKTTTTAESGYFIIELHNQSDKIILSSIGYNDKIIAVANIPSKPMVFYMESKSNMLSETVVYGNSNDKLQTSNIGLTVLSQKTIKNIPTVFGEADIIKSLQLQPGVSAGIEGFAGMLVHGGNDDQNLFLLDGNPIYQMNHLGGLFSAYNVESVKDLSFYKAAFPSRYGGRLSSVVDITTADGDYNKYHGNLMLGLTSGNISISGPIIKDKTSFHIAIRRSWLELISVPALWVMNASKKKEGKKEIGNYAFTDLNIKLNQRIGQTGELSLLLYYGNDKLKIGEHEFSTDKAEDAEHYLHKDINRLNWGNFLTALKWKTKFSDNLTYDLSASYTRYKSEQSQLIETDYGIKGEENYEREEMHKNLTNGIDDFNVSTSLTYRVTPNYLLRFGLNYVNHLFTPQRIDNSSTNGQIIENNTHERLSANEASAFIDADIQPVSWLQINAGVRGSLFNISGVTYKMIEPRLSANVMLLPTMSVKAGYSRMNQFVQQISDSYVSLPTDFWMPITDAFKPLNSDQISAGFYYKIANKYTLSIEGYYKWMRNLLEYKDGYDLMPTSISWNEKLTSGTGTAYGIDFMIEKDFGRFKGFLGYGLMWTDRHFDELNNGRNFPSKYDNRHKVNISLSYILRPNIDINLSWTYMTGNRVTLSLENYQYINGFPTNIAPGYPNNDEDMLNYYSSKNNVRLPAYHRLDLGLNIYMPKKNNHLGIWNVSIYNAYCQMNPIVIQKCNDKSTINGEVLKPRFRTLALFPIIPSVSYTYKF
ncbi:MAG: carboxypeptidase-like regulatory domain-containing protein [Muribaculaceae bacterium]